MENKRGNIPIAIFVIGVVMVCILTLVSFISSSFLFKQSLYGLSDVELLNSQVDEYVFYLNRGLSAEDINNFFNISDGKFIVKSESQNSFPYLKKSKIMFSIEYPVPKK